MISLFVLSLLYTVSVATGVQAVRPHHGHGAVAARSLPTKMVSTDTLVYASNPAGIGAAIAASNNNQNTVQLVERLTSIGGMGSAGSVGLMNQGCGLAGVTGLGYEWGMLNGRYYNPDKPTLNVFPDPHVGEQSFWTMLNNYSSITVTVGCYLVEVSHDTNDNSCLSGAVFLCNNETEQLIINATVFIDASYDGDIMVQSGTVEYTNGREGSDVYNESLAGVQLQNEENENFAAQNLTINAYLPNGQLLPGITSAPLLPIGTGDNRLMAFSYFPCVTDDVNNSVPYPMPPNYNPDDFALLQRQIEGVMANGKYPNGPDLGYFSEFDAFDSNSSSPKLLLCCGVGPVNCDQPDLNQGWAVANNSERIRIEALHKYYLLGSLYYMANDPRVPNYTRYSIGRWGLCKDEFVTNSYWPPQIYVRISNRLKGQFLITQNNIANPRNKPEGVSMGCWEFDQHTMSRHAVPNPKNNSEFIALNEGYMRYELTEPFRSCTHPEAQCTAEGNWYDVPFTATVPQTGQASNLLVPVAISSTSIAYSSTRIEGMYMDLGTAAGVAASLILQDQKTRKVNGTSMCPTTTVQQVNITNIQNILVNTYHQRIHGPINSSTLYGNYYHQESIETTD